MIDITEFLLILFSGWVMAIIGVLAGWLITRKTRQEEGSLKKTVNDNQERVVKLDNDLEFDHNIGEPELDESLTERSRAFLEQMGMSEVLKQQQSRESDEWKKGAKINASE